MINTNLSVPSVPKQIQPVTIVIVPVVVGVGGSHPVDDAAVVPPPVRPVKGPPFPRVVHIPIRTPETKSAPPPLPGIFIGSGSPPPESSPPPPSLAGSAPPASGEPVVAATEPPPAPLL